MGVASGRVIGSETAAGIGGLVVSAYAAAAGADGEPVSDGLAGLGSTVTDAGGAFQIEYQMPESLHGRGDLVVSVQAPDDAGGQSGDGSPPLVTSRRSSPGPRETFLIRIPGEALSRADLPAVAGALQQRDPGAVVARQVLAREFEAAIESDSRKVLAARLSAAAATRQQVDGYFGRFLRALSGADRGTVRYVEPGESIADASTAATRDGLNSHINSLVLDAAAVFSDAQLASLAQQYGASLTDIPARVIDDMVWPGRHRGGAPTRVWEAAQWCAKQAPINDCVKMLDPARDGDGTRGVDEGHESHSTGPGTTPQPGAPPHGGAPSAVGVAAKPETVDGLVTRLTSTMTSPEERVLFGVRPGVGDVQGSVDGLSLRSGPADVPAVYDFHRLQIAFAPVWQELFDRTCVQTGRQLYETFVELGEDPNKYLLDPGEGLVSLPQMILPWRLSGAERPPQPGVTEPPPDVVQEFGITKPEWNALPATHQEQLKVLAGQAANPSPVMVQIGTGPPVPWGGTPDQIRAKAARIIAYAKEKLKEPRAFDQMHELLEALAKQLKEPYRFNVYAAGRTGRSINFGLLVTYRQKWTPVNYQVGELVQTIPLAPKEVRKYTKRSVRKLSRSEKEMRSSLQSLRSETSVTARVESEIISKARNKTNFETGTEGGFQFGVGRGSGNAKIGVDAERDSAETKREFRESVFKAVAEYRSEHKVEVESSSAEEFAEEHSGEISNPNDELPVTYLFYELQRRYRVEEKLAKATPVILVAQEFPNPDEIDDDWIVANDWILRRVILDDSFVPAINYLATKVVGDERALRELYDTLQQRRRLLEDMGGELVTVRGLMADRYAALQSATGERTSAMATESRESFLEDIAESFTGTSEPDADALRLTEDAAKDAYERVERQERELRERLDRETSAVDELSNAYTQQLSEHLNRRTQISRLRVHLKANIVYYMQAIYAHEPADQRYFRLRDVPVPRLRGEKTYTIVADPDAVPVPPTWTKPHKLQVKVSIDPNKLEYDALGDIADLDTMLGFKGNYLMFPLKQDNALTDFMTTPYYDPFTGLRDPDALANWTLPEFAQYVCCLKEHGNSDEFLSHLPGLTEVYRRLKERESDTGEIVVPTGSLYIEALPGAHPILEDFKLAHRAIDVKKAQGDVRLAELENLRMAARLLVDEHEDPRIDKKIIIEGAAGVSVDPDNT